MSTGEICRLALSRGLIRCQGKTPEATMASALYTDVKRKEAMSVFIRPLEGLFGLREWEDEGFVPPGPDGRPITDYQPLRTSRVRKPVLKRGRSGRDDSLTDTPKRRGGASKQEDARRGPGRPRKRAARDDDDPSYFAGCAPPRVRLARRVCEMTRAHADPCASLGLAARLAGRVAPSGWCAGVGGTRISSTGTLTRTRTTTTSTSTARQSRRTRTWRRWHMRGRRWPRR